MLFTVPLYIDVRAYDMYILSLLRLTCTVCLYICNIHIYCIVRSGIDARATTLGHRNDKFLPNFTFLFSTFVPSERAPPRVRSSVAFWQFEFLVFRLSSLTQLFPRFTQSYPFYLNFLFPRYSSHKRNASVVSVKYVYLFLKILRRAQYTIWSSSWFICLFGRLESTANADFNALVFFPPISLVVHESCRTRETFPFLFIRVIWFYMDMY